jgi:phosphopantetheinyl transferase (holo-ACP synthase)
MYMAFKPSLSAKVLGIGCDVARVSRVAAVARRYGDRFLRR